MQKWTLLHLSKTCNGVLFTVWHCYFYLRAGCDVASQASVLLWDSLERTVKTPLSSEHINNTTALINAGMQQLHELILHCALRARACVCVSYRSV